MFLVNVFRGLFGVFGLGVPPALAAAGLLLLGRPRESNPRVVTGVLLVLAAAIGLWHLSQGAPTVEDGLPVLHRAGGWFGLVLAVPLESIAAAPGAAVVLIGLLCAGLLVLTATPPRLLAQAVWSFFVVPRGEDDDVAEVVEEEQDGFVEDFADEPIDTVPPAPAGLVVEEADEEEDDEPLERADLASLPPTLDVGAEAGKATKVLPRTRDFGDYQLPPLDLLRTGRLATGNRRAMEQMTRALERTLSQFGVDARVAKVSRGPTVTRFEIELGEGVKVAAITKLEKDIAYALATPEIRIVAPIPGKVAIGIEVPNAERDLITLGDVLRSEEAAAAVHPLMAALGKDISGNAVLVNLAKMPHLLIAGATGSGKSVTMNGIITSILMRNPPDRVKMILVDPKRVELSTYEDVPHLLTPVVTDPKRAKDALDWVVGEMERRYSLLAKYGHRKLDTFNAAAMDGTLRDVPLLEEDDADRDGSAQMAMPYILCVIDELADLMMVAPRDIEAAIVRIAQMARAVGIHMILATQRPSVDVITGLIKANIPSRIALAMATGHDSKTILDQHGAEKLVGDGDMLYMPANASKPHRMQGCFVHESEIEAVVAHCKAQVEASYVSGVVKEGEEAVKADLQGDDVSDEDLTRAAMELVVRSGLGSTSMLQRKLKVGFARAGRLMDELEQMGVVGPSEGPKARAVLMTVEELEERLGA